MKNIRLFLLVSAVSTIIVVAFSSCASTKNVPYFQNVPDSAKQRIEDEAVYNPPVILPDDILTVTITTIDPSSAAPVNQAPSVPVASSSISPTTTVPGLLVDKDGNITLPILGVLKVAGLTSEQAKAYIKKTADLYYKDTDVQLRFANFKITVLGEVLRPSSYTVPNEKVSVLDALGLAGDLTIYGRRENVLVIRDVNGKKEMGRIDLNSTDLFRSPYYFLKQNDVVYVQPNKSKIIQADASQTRVVTIAASIASALIILLIRLH